MSRIVLCCALGFVFLLGHMPASIAQTDDGEGQAYVIQKGDQLFRIARQFLGSAQSYQLIVDATNEKAKTDRSFRVIEDIHAIKFGDKVWIPAAAEAAETQERPAEETAETQSENLLEFEFAKDHSEFTTDWDSRPGEGDISNLAAEQGLTIKENTTIYAKKLTPADPTKTYRMKVLVRLPRNEASSKSANIYIGVFPFDSEKYLLKGEKDNFLKFVNDGPIDEARPVDSDGWTELTGTITGTSTDSLTAFLPDTAYMRPTIVVYPGSTDAPVEVKALVLSIEQ